MPSSKKLKICKVESEAFAKYCLMRGADYLGIHCIEHELDPQKQRLCQYVSQRGGNVVLVTKEQSLAALRSLVTFYKPWAVQLHLPMMPEQHTRLERALGVPVIPVVTDETSSAAVTALLRQSQFVIYDSSYRGGTNKRHRRTHLRGLAEDLAAKVMLAGGITPDAIRNEPSELWGYDVQSYCRSDSAHHFGRAEQLLDAAKGFPKRQLSVSLTDAHLQAIPAYPAIGALEYQLDYSAGNLYSHFAVDPEHVTRAATSFDAPFTLHIFEATPKAFQKVIDDYRALAGRAIVRINIQYSPGLSVESIATYDAKTCISIYYKDLKAYFRQYPEGHPCVSLILASELDRFQSVLIEESGLIARLNDKEVWFDRKIDPGRVRLIRTVHKNANVIAGEYVITDWQREKLLLEALNG